MRSIRIACQSIAAIVFAWPMLFCQAAPIDPAGQWFSVPGELQQAGRQAGNFDLAGVDVSTLTPLATPTITGGHFLFRGSFDIPRDDDYVIDFKNSSTLGKFRHVVLDSAGQEVASSQGGIMSPEVNPFFLRHGRALALKAGHYQLVTELVSPYFIAPPQPYLDGLDDYRQSIKLTNALTLVCLGIFIALGIYYAALAGVRLHIAEGMYAVFILGNLIFNSAGLLVLSDLFGIHEFYLSSAPILISNLAYVVFVIHLLGISPVSNRKLFYTGIALLAVMVFFIGLAYLNPGWTLEFARYGVGLFLCYGLVAGFTTGYQGNTSGRLYVVAILVFFALGGVAITSQGLVGSYSFYIEHLGLLSVATEAILLALVLSYQFAQLHRDKEHALSRLQKSEHIAMTDALTGLPNRYALEFEIIKLPPSGSLTFLDLDGLKYYNDKFGHERGDQLLTRFGHTLRRKLHGKSILHRLGGDEFAITSLGGHQEFIAQMLTETVSELKAGGFEFAGFSSGTVFVHESGDITSLMHLADTRMYANKRQRKEAAGTMTLPKIAGS